MTEPNALTPEEEARYAALSDWADSDDAADVLADAEGITPAAGDTEPGRQLLEQFMPGEEIDRATRGRPRLDPAEPGPSPTLSVRLSQATKDELRSMGQAKGLGRNAASAVARLAIDEYLAAHRSEVDATSGAGSR